MIKLEPFVDSDVLIQFKTPLYVVGTGPQGLVPIGDNGPLAIDRMQGRLSVRDGQPVLSYASPINPSDQIDYVLDPENVAGMWVARKIQISLAGVGR